MSSCHLRPQPAYCCRRPTTSTLPSHEGAYSLNVIGDYACVRTGLHAGFSGSADEVFALLKLKAESHNIYAYGADISAFEALPHIKHQGPASTELSGKTIDLRQAKFAAKRRRGNPYSAYRWPLALAVTLIISMSLHYHFEARFLSSENEQLNNAIASDYKSVFKRVIEPNWQAAARYQASVAKQQLGGTGLENWHLLRHLNEAIGQCRACVIEEFSLNQRGALLTVNTKDSEPLIAAVNNSDVLQLTNQQPMESNTTLTISLGGPHG